MDKRTLHSRKGRPRSARPYDRQNQSILGKVCSTVKGLLNPSWLFNVSQWIGNSEEQQPGGSSDEIEEETVREDSDVVCQSVTHGSKRLRLRFDDNAPSIQSSGTQTWPEQPPQNLYENMSPVQSSSTQSTLLENKETIAALNGDDHSENSEGSASTSGCSSLVSSHKESNRLVESPFVNLLELKNSRKRKLSSSKSGLNDLDNSRALWSSNFSPKLQRRYPSISHTNQPSFNLSSFVGPSKMNEYVENKVSSPFYEGRTTFGGASASRRMPPSSTLYQTERNVRNKIQVREQASDDSLEGMSSAAKRILLTLQKMSTPVVDAQKIPNSDTSPIDLSLYLTPPKSRRNSQFTPSFASKGPPITNINTFAKLATLKNYGASRLRSTLLSPSPSSPSNSKIEKTDMESKPFVFSSPVEPNMPNYNVFPKENILPTPCDSKLGNKSDMQPKPFVFSSPIEIEPPNNSLPKENILLSTLTSKIEKSSDVQTNHFVFSNPIEHELPNNNTLPKENIPLPDNSSIKIGVSSATTWECSSCWVRNPCSKTSCLACETPKVLKDKSSTLKFKSSEEAKSSPVVTTSSPMPGCFGFSPVIPASSAAACTFGSSKPENESLTPSSKTLTFGLDSKKMWECDACWVRNYETDTKCKACETTRPQFQTINLPAKKVNSTVSSPFSTSEWECTSCWVRNSMKVKKCVACETLHPSTDVTSGFAFKPQTIPTITLSSPHSSTSEQDSGSSTPVSTGGFVFGTSKSDSQDAATTTTFSFGSGLGKSQNTPIPSYQSTTSATVTSEKLEFGTPKAEGQKTTPANFSFGSGAPSPGKSTSKSVQQEKPAFKFGSQTSESVATSVTPPPQSNTEVSKEILSSGLSNTVADSSPATKFVFGSKSDVSEKISSTIPQATSNFTFGSKNGNTNTVTENNTTEKTFKSSTPVPPVFGNSSVQLSGEADKPSSTEFNFKGAASGTFQFGASNKSMPATSTTATAVSPLSTWECSSCWVRNPHNKTICVACETPQAPKETSSAVKGKSVEENKNTTALVSTTATVSTAGFSFGNLVSSPSVFTIGTTKSDSQTVKSSKPFSFGLDSNASALGKKSVATNLETDSKCKDESAPPSKDNLNAKGFTFKDFEKPQSLLSIPSATASSAKFVFGASKTESQNTTPAPFVFGSGLEKSQTTPSVPSSTSQSAITDNTLTSSPFGGFVFGTPKTEAQNVVPVPFSFGSVKGLQKSQTPAPVSSSVSQSTTSGLNIGTTAPTSSGGFVFGTPKTEAQNASATPFAFGSGVTSSSNTSAFSAFQPTQAGNATFKFGSQPPGSTAPAVAPSNFSFAKSEAPNQILDPMSQNPGSVFGKTTTNFVFGSKSDTSNQIPSTVSQPSSLAFGSPANFTFSGKNENTNATSQNNNPTFGSSAIQSVFGNTAAQSFGGTKKPVSGGFNFGVTSPSVFQFGASSPANAEKKRSATASGFSFGGPSAPENTTTFSTGFSMSTPQNFHFGASSTPTAGPFQFAASTPPSTAPAQNAPRKYRKALRRVPRKE